MSDSISRRQAICTLIIRLKNSPDNRLGQDDIEDVLCALPSVEREREKKQKGKTMTNGEAISFLRGIQKIILKSNSWLESTDEPIIEALDMAIEALEIDL